MFSHFAHLRYLSIAEANNSSFVVLSYPLAYVRRIKGTWRVWSHRFSVNIVGMNAASRLKMQACDFLVHIFKKSGHLSWSKVLTPSVPVVPINPPYKPVNALGEREQRSLGNHVHESPKARGTHGREAVRLCQSLRAVRWLYIITCCRFRRESQTCCDRTAPASVRLSAEAFVFRTHLYLDLPWWEHLL